MGEHSYIQCSGCGGRHARPGGSLCKILRSGKLFNVEEFDEEYEEKREGATKAISKGVPWSDIVSLSELGEVPDRSDSCYLDYCEKTIELLQAKLRTAEDSEKVIKAESTITNLLSQLQIGSGTKLKRRVSSLDHSMHGGRAPAASASSDPFIPSCLKVVEETDTRDYLSKLRPEHHIIPKKQFDSMNYRELVLGMSCVHSHLVQNGRPTRGYESHCLFIQRKACSFLYTNSANNLYDRYVTDRVMSGELDDYPSTCADAAMEFCDSYRRENSQIHSEKSPMGKQGNKPWSGYPYPFCYFWNEHNCCKRNCNLKHECGFCRTPDHKSRDCTKSSWKGTPLRPESPHTSSSTQASDI